MEIVRQHIPTGAEIDAYNDAHREEINKPIDLDLARDIVTAARDIIERMDGRRMTEIDLQTVLADTFDLAFYITGVPWHLNSDGIETRARVLAGAA